MFVFLLLLFYSFLAIPKPGLLYRTEDFSDVVAEVRRDVFRHSTGRDPTACPLEWTHLHRQHRRGRKASITLRRNRQWGESSSCLLFSAVAVLATCTHNCGGPVGTRGLQVELFGDRIRYGRQADERVRWASTKQVARTIACA